MLIEKTLAEEKRRIRGLIRRFDNQLRREFVKFLRDVKSETTMRQVRRLLERGSLIDALNIVDSHIFRFGDILPRIFQQVAIGEISSLSNITNFQAPAISLSFNPTNQRAASLMRQSRLEFITDFSNRQRRAVRFALSDALLTGDSPRAAANNFRDAIGLTRTQLRTVETFRSILQNNSVEALRRELRDRRFDPTIIRASRENEPLSPDQINRMVSRFRSRALQFRAETIARTETQKVLNIARNEALEQALEQTGLERSRVRRRWNTTIDGRERLTHNPMNGQLRGMDEPFVSPSGVRLMFPGDPSAPIKEIAQCRCVSTISILRR